MTEHTKPDVSRERHNDRCRRCLHVRSLHWRPACNHVGCDCRKFEDSPDAI